jgi:hypothetical protein
LNSLMLESPAASLSLWPLLYTPILCRGFCNAVIDLRPMYISSIRVPFTLSSRLVSAPDLREPSQHFSSVSYEFVIKGRIERGDHPCSYPFSVINDSARWAQSDIQTMLEDVLLKNARQRWLRGYDGTIAVRLAPPQSSGRIQRISYSIYKAPLPRIFNQTHECQILWTPKPFPDKMWKGSYNGQFVGYRLSVTEDVISDLFLQEAVRVRCYKEERSKTYRLMWISLA